jgi:hypothetical protein
VPGGTTTRHGSTHRSTRESTDAAARGSGAPAPYRTVQHRTVQQRTVQHRAVQHRTAPCYSSAAPGSRKQVWQHACAARDPNPDGYGLWCLWGQLAAAARQEPPPLLFSIVRRKSRLSMYDAPVSPSTNTGRCRASVGVPGMRHAVSAQPPPQPGGTSLGNTTQSTTTKFPHNCPFSTAIPESYIGSSQLPFPHAQTHNTKQPLAWWQCIVSNSSLLKLASRPAFHSTHRTNTTQTPGLARR